MSQAPQLDVSININANPSSLKALQQQVKGALKVQLELDGKSIKTIENLRSRVSPIKFEFDPGLASQFASKAQSYFSAHPIKLKVEYVTGKNSGSVAGDVAKNIEKTTKAQKEGTIAQNAYAASTNKVSASVGTFGERVGFTANRFAAYLLAAAPVFQLVRGLGAATQSITDTNREIVKLTQILEGNSKLAGDIADSVLDTAVKYGQSGKEILKTASLLAQSGPQFANNAKGIESVSEALAKSQLAATFGSLSETTQGALAYLNQFNLAAEDTNRVLDVSNELAKKFAVESGDLFQAVKSGGAAFSALGGSMEDFQSVVTTLRQTTRLSADTIGTGINTIVLRVFRPDNVKFLKSIGVEAVNANGKFRDFVDIINDTSKAFENLDDVSKGVTIEKLFGTRQGKLGIKLLENTDLLTQTKAVAQNASGSLNRDAILSLERFDVQFQRVVSNFDRAFKEIAENKEFKVFVKDVATSLSTLADSLKQIAPLIPTLLKLGTAFGLGFALKNIPPLIRGAGLSGIGTLRSVKNQQLNRNSNASARLSNSLSVEADASVINNLTQQGINSDIPKLTQRSFLGIRSPNNFNFTSSIPFKDNDDILSKLKNRKDDLDRRIIAAEARIQADTERLNLVTSDKRRKTGQNIIAFLRGEKDRLTSKLGETVSDIGTFARENPQIALANKLIRSSNALLKDDRFGKVVKNTQAETIAGKDPLASVAEARKLLINVLTRDGKVLNELNQKLDVLKRSGASEPVIKQAETAIGNFTKQYDVNKKTFADVSKALSFQLNARTVSLQNQAKSEAKRLSEVAKSAGINISGTKVRTPTVGSALRGVGSAAGNVVSAGADASVGTLGRGVTSFLSGFPKLNLLPSKESIDLIAKDISNFNIDNARAVKVIARDFRATFRPITKALIQTGKTLFTGYENPFASRTPVINTETESNGSTLFNQRRNQQHIQEIKDFFSGRGVIDSIKNDQGLNTTASAIKNFGSKVFSPVTDLVDRVSIATKEPISDLAKKFRVLGTTTSESMTNLRRNIANSVEKIGTGVISATEAASGFGNRVFNSRISQQLAVATLKPIRNVIRTLDAAKGTVGAAAAPILLDQLANSSFFGQKDIIDASGGERVNSPSIIKQNQSNLRVSNTLSSAASFATFGAAVSGFNPVITAVIAGIGALKGALDPVVDPLFEAAKAFGQMADSLPKTADNIDQIVALLNKAVAQSEEGGKQEKGGIVNQAVKEGLQGIGNVLLNPSSLFQFSGLNEKTDLNANNDPDRDRRRKLIEDNATIRNELSGIVNVATEAFGESFVKAGIKPKDATRESVNAIEVLGRKNIINKINSDQLIPDVLKSEAISKALKAFELGATAAANKMVDADKALRDFGKGVKEADSSMIKFIFGLQRANIQLERSNLSGTVLNEQFANKQNSIFGNGSIAAISGNEIQDRQNKAANFFENGGKFKDFKDLVGVGSTPEEEANRNRSATILSQVSTLRKTAQDTAIDLISASKLSEKFGDKQSAAIDLEAAKRGTSDLITDFQDKIRKLDNIDPKIQAQIIQSAAEAKQGITGALDNDKLQSIADSFFKGINPVFDEFAKTIKLGAEKTNVEIQKFNQQIELLAKITSDSIANINLAFSNKSAFRGRSESLTLTQAGSINQLRGLGGETDTNLAAVINAGKDLTDFKQLLVNQKEPISKEQSIKNAELTDKLAIAQAKLGNSTNSLSELFGKLVEKLNRTIAGLETIGSGSRSSILSNVRQERIAARDSTFQSLLKEGIGSKTEADFVSNVSQGTARRAFLNQRLFTRLRDIAQNNPEGKLAGSDRTNQEVFKTFSATRGLFGGTGNFAENQKNVSGILGEAGSINDKLLSVGNSQLKVQQDILKVQEELFKKQFGKDSLDSLLKDLNSDKTSVASNYQKNAEDKTDLVANSITKKLDSFFGDTNKSKNEFLTKGLSPETIAKNQATAARNRHKFKFGDNANRDFIPLDDAAMDARRAANRIPDEVLSQINKKDPRSNKEENQLLRENALANGLNRLSEIMSKMNPADITPALSNDGTVKNVKVEAVVSGLEGIALRGPEGAAMAKATLEMIYNNIPVTDKSGLREALIRAQKDIDTASKQPPKQ